jgi:hypothetical protein
LSSLRIETLAEFLGGVLSIGLLSPLNKLALEVGRNPVINWNVPALLGS